MSGSQRVNISLKSSMCNMAPLTERFPSSPSSNEFHTLILMALYPSPDPDFDSYKSTSAILSEFKETLQSQSPINSV